MRIGLRLPFRFDIDRLHDDLAKVLPPDWSPHFNEQDYGGTWRGTALRSATGSSGDLHAPPGSRDFAGTSLLERCTYFREVLSVFRCPLRSVRLLGLAPHSFIREHSDHALGYEDGEIRIHVPIRTNPDVEFYVAGERILLEEGRSYFVNVNLPHRVNNRGAAERVHLVIDAAVNDWVHDLIRQGDAEGWHIPRCLLPPGSLDDFRRIVLDEPCLQARLRTIEDRRRFVAAVLALGRERGFDFHEGDVDAGFRHAFGNGERAPVSGWTPTSVAFQDSRPVADWLWVGERRFTAPFFTDSIRECARLPFAGFLQRSAPLEMAQDVETLAPSGFIFHMSRCGSTLVSRMFASLPRVKVISEAPPLDAILRANRVPWLRWMIAALGQPQADGQTHYILKLDAWHIRSLPLVREAFPETPWIFLHRDPAEVAVSQFRSPGLLGAPGMMDPAVLGLEPQDAGLDREQWCVRVLASLLESARAFAGDPKGVFVDYRELPRAVYHRIAPHFGLELDRREQELMEETSQFDAKRPSFEYRDDTESKQIEAGTRLRELVREWILPVAIA